MKLFFLLVLSAAELLAAQVDAFTFPFRKTTQGNRSVLEWRFEAAKEISAIYQANGAGDFVLSNAPGSYRWSASHDGEQWVSIAAVTDELRLHRVHPVNIALRALRLELPATNEVRAIQFITGVPLNTNVPPWVLLVNSTHDSTLPGHGQEFLQLIRSIPGWEQVRAQQIWVRDCSPAFLAIEPRPLAVFFSGSFKDWCEVDRGDWRGVEEILRISPVPIWASCGGAQALAILAETGTAKPWDCPHCRDPLNPKLPIYTHIGHTGQAACGDYSKCVFERGSYQARKLRDDPAFAGLPEEFSVMQSHCGQIEWAPAGWEVIATAGQGSLTQTQCLKRRDAPIYAAQFHIEMAGTPESSRRIMANFLALASEWWRGR